MGFLQNIADFLLLVFYLLTLWPYEIIKSMFFPRKRKDINEEVNSFFVILKIKCGIQCVHKKTD